MMAAERLDEAYQALRARDYGRAITLLEREVEASPQRTSVRKDLAYTLLKTGEPAAARDQFREVMRLDPADVDATLEYAFQANETRQEQAARRVFDRLRKAGNKTAEQAFQNIDQPLKVGIDRWTQALASSPDNFSAHEELARLAEKRDELVLAAEHYRHALRLKPQLRSLLLDLGRVYRELGQQEEANTALLAASRGSESRTAEEARELLPTRYPFVYEFRQAIKLDAANADLRRELAFLLLKMGRKEDAEAEFLRLLEIAPADMLSAAQVGFLRLERGATSQAMPLLERVLASSDTALMEKVRLALAPYKTGRKQSQAAPLVKASPEAKTMAFRSLEKGFVKDALQYLLSAHENDPSDFQVILKLGWAYNLLHDDLQALHWFDLARKSPDAAIASEAKKAYNSLRPAFAKFRTSAWVFPFFSTRWHDVFAYGQVKTEMRISWFPLRPYLSARLIGDTRGKTSDMLPQPLSESSIVLAAGVATPYAKGPFNGLMGWFEAGEAVSYRALVPNQKDFRGGLAYSRAWKRHSMFAETNADGIFVSRFSNDMLLYSQTRTGFGVPTPEALPMQLFWNYNATVDLLGQYWANYVETGPGVRVRLPHSVLFSVNLLRGANLINQGNPRRPNYFDLRAGFSYAIAH